MPTLLIRFPGRRYHATPWGHHVNEGLIEWPPSPWRLIRALISTGYTKGVWDSYGPYLVARSLIMKLTGTLPNYSLPQAVGAHSRHYMPLASFKAPSAKTDISLIIAHQINNGPVVHGYKEDTTLVFDTWAQIDDGVLAVTWNVELDEQETSLLAILSSKLGYLGRSESWIEARLAGEGEPLPETNCCPDAPPGQGWEQVSLLAPMDEGPFEQWRQGALEEALAVYPRIDENKSKLSREEKKLIDQRKKAREPYPTDMLDALQKDTNWLRKHGWSQPPGSRRVFYYRRRDALKVGATRRHITPVAPPVKVMLLSMATATGNKHALPSVIHTLIHGERLHKALVSIVDRHNIVLCGCLETGEPLKGRHEHAHILPLDLDNDGHLDHFVIWAPMGLDDAAQKAVRAVRKTYAKNVKALYLALAASCSETKELNSLPGQYGNNLRLLLGLTGATEWVSHTPFVPPRYLKPSGRNSLQGQVVAELESRGLPAPVDVKVLDPRDDPVYLRHRHFTRLRKVGPAPPIDCGFTMALRFDQPVTGPICLGYSAHFGLGLFAAVEDNSPEER